MCVCVCVVNSSYGSTQRDLFTQTLEFIAYQSCPLRKLHWECGVDYTHKAQHCPQLAHSPGRLAPPQGARTGQTFSRPQWEQILMNWKEVNGRPRTRRSAISFASFKMSPHPLYQRPNPLKDQRGALPFSRSGCRVHMRKRNREICVGDLKRKVCCHANLCPQRTQKRTQFHAPIHSAAPRPIACTLPAMFLPASHSLSSPRH